MDAVAKAIQRGGRMNSPCPYICNNKTDYGYCKTSACINPTHRTPTFTSYDPIEIARQYAPKFDKPVVDMVEVVRCKQCKWIDLCKDPEHYEYKGANGFCSKGERKDGEKND